MSGKAFFDRDVVVKLNFKNNPFGEKVTYDKLSLCLPHSLLAHIRPALNRPAAGKT